MERHIIESVGQMALGDIRNYGPITINIAGDAIRALNIKALKTGCITEDQKLDLRRQIGRVIEVEWLVKRKRLSSQKIFRALNAHCGVSSYHQIRVEDYAKAELFLRHWIERIPYEANWEREMALRKFKRYVVEKCAEQTR